MAILYQFYEGLFSDLTVPWWENPRYLELMSSIRKSPGTLTRDIWIVTSGPLTIASVCSFLEELEVAEGLFAIHKANERFQWHAMNHDLSNEQSELLQQKFSKLGAKFITLNDDSEFQNTTAGMYDARKVVQEYVISSDSNPIVCWLDSDLVNSVMVHDENCLKKIQLWPWIHMVWFAWLCRPEIDVWVGDVTGDAPVPASSTIHSNLKDLMNSGPTAGSERWKLRDPAYDYSEIENANLPFPPIGKGLDDSNDLTEDLLWKGTVYRPLVANEEILQKPHRPWYVRGGVTILFNLELMKTKTPRFRFKDFQLRRGDSFWIVKNKLIFNIKIGHWKFPLLHNRVELNCSSDELISLFYNRFVGDFLAACCLKSYVDGHGWERESFREHFRRKLEVRANKVKSDIQGSISLLQSFETGSVKFSELTVQNALVLIHSFLNTFKIDDVLNCVSEQLFGYMEK
tara:strand:- start:1702 stop:3075 length:1374 start_codon:yes stop_codon:yes gene_type:complete